MINNIRIALIIALIMAGSLPHGFGMRSCCDLSVTWQVADTGTRQIKGLITPKREWMYVQERMDGTCHAVYDSVLRIHYEEPYTVSNHQRLRFKVYDKYRNVVVQTDNAGNITDSICGAITQSPIIRTGENWLEINFWCFNLNEGDYYYLEVWNGKGEKGFLRFKVMPS
jgi:hypothetical protein